MFLDTQELLPGGVWPRVLAQAQDSSAVTVILVSKHTAAAYYQLEELAEAIHLSRNGGSGHRVAPVYLEPVERLPYGLRVVHGLWALDPAGIEDAARQLLRLLPHPGDKALAKVWSRQIPVVTVFFAGRDELLGRLAGHGPQRTSVLTQSVAGLGGVGKTTLAAALCWEQAEVTDIVWWLQADTETTVIAGLADLAVELGVAGAGSEDLAVAADGACRALEGGGRRWLLVFDNAESDTLVHRYTPKRGDGRVVVTTRRQDFRRLGPVVVVDVFDPVTAEDFLRSRVKDTNPAAAREPHAAEVARRLGGLPLALEQAGAYVAYSPRRSFAAYLDLLDDYRLDPFVDGVPLDYQASATTTWQVSIDAAARTALLAPKIMAAFASLAPAPVPVACFADLADHPYMAADADTNAVTAAIDVLYAYSLISIDHDSLSVHRMVRDASLRLGDQAASRFVVAALCHVHPPDVEPPGTWTLCAELLPHVLNVAADVTADTAAEIEWLLDRAGVALRCAGAAAQAIPLLKDAAILAADLHGVDHPNTLTRRYNLAVAYQDAGRTDDAMGRTDDATTLLEANLTDRERVLGPDHPDTLASRHNLARAYRADGRIPEAVTLSQANLTDRERVLGPDHPDTLASRHNLARAYFEAGRTDEASALHQANTVNRKRVLGPDHPDTLQSRLNYARCLRKVKRLSEAIALLERNVADMEKMVGANHPWSLANRHNLALAYYDSGRISKAVALLETNLAARERVLGPDHPDTLANHYNLALAYQAAGRISEAVVLLETNLAARQRILGPDHPDTLLSRDSLAIVTRLS